MVYMQTAGGGMDLTRLHRRFWYHFAMVIFLERGLAKPRLCLNLSYKLACFSIVSEVLVVPDMLIMLFRGPGRWSPSLSVVITMTSCRGFARLLAAFSDLIRRRWASRSGSESSMISSMLPWVVVGGRRFSEAMIEAARCCRH